MSGKEKKKPSAEQEAEALAGTVEHQASIVAEVLAGTVEHQASIVRFNDELQYIPAPDFPEEEGTGAEDAAKSKSHMMEYLSISLGIRTTPKVLDEVSFEGVARYIASGKVHNIVTLVGAGISTTAGIPDFRSPSVGLYEKLKKEYGVSDPETLFSSQYFLKDSKPFYEQAHLFFTGDHKPTPCHYFVRLLEEKGLLLRHYTQNIDTLDLMAGISEERTIEAHGSWAKSYCQVCFEDYDYDWMKEKVTSDVGVPKCEMQGCSGTIKPDIVLFGESLNWRFSENAVTDLQKCDLLIIMGTSLTVQPIASLTSKVPVATPRVYINMEKGDVSKKHPLAALMFGGSFDFDEPDNVRDIFKRCDCDTGCLELADLLGWGDELRELVRTEHSRLDEKYAAKAKAQQAAKPKTVVPAKAAPTERTSVTAKKSATAVAAMGQDTPAVAAKGQGTPTVAAKGQGTTAVAAKGQGTPAVAAKGQGTPAVAAKDHGTPTVARRGSTPVAAKGSSHPIKGRTSATPKAKPVSAAGQKGSKESVTSGTKLKATARAAQVRPSTWSPRKASTPSPRQSAPKTSLSLPRPSRAAASTADMRSSANGSPRNRLTPSPRLSASKVSLSSPRPLKASASTAEVSPSADESPRNGLTPSPQLSASKESLSSPRPLKAAASKAEVSPGADESPRNGLTPPQQSASQISLSSPRPSRQTRDN